MHITHYINALVTTSGRDRRHTNRLLNLSGLLDSFTPCLSVAGFTEAVTESFVYFLKSHAKGYRPGTVSNYYQLLCYVLNRAAKEYTISAGYMNVRVSTEESAAVYLTPAEISRLIELKDISQRAAVIRDYFVLMCYTGLRLSDARRLSRDNILKDKIVLKSQKTRFSVEIPIHPCVSDIFARWNNKPPGCSTQQAFYKTLQRLCSYAGITESVVVEKTKGLNIVREARPKCELVTPHTARRSFATNLYLSSEVDYIPLYRIMLLTGHKTESSFFKYIRIQKNENARVMGNHSFFK